MMKRLSALILLLLLAGPAQAGRGASYASIMEAIRTDNADVIISELERAERLVCSACLAPVMDLLDDDNYRIREVAAWWFARRPALKLVLAQEMTARLSGSDARLARNAADILGTFRHPAALPALAGAIARTDLSDEARAAAVRAVGTIAHESGESAVITAFGADGAQTRLAAVQAFHDLRGVRSAAPVLGLVTDTDVLVRRRAVAVVGSLKLTSARSALEDRLLHDTDALVRRNAAWALGEIGGAESRAVLEQVAREDVSSIVRSVAAGAMR
jgi:HEAT repeat protein